MRILFVVPPLAGHTLPTVAVADELRRGGHSVAWASYRNLVEPVLPAWADVLAVGEDVDRDRVREISVGAEAMRGFSALKFLYDDLFLPMARDMAPGIEQALDEFRPDVVVSDIQAFAGAAVARRRSLPYVTSVSTWAELTGQLSTFPKVAQGLHDSLVQLQLDLGVPAAAARRGDLRVSDHLSLIYSTPEFTGALQAPYGSSAPLRFVGPALPRRDSGDWRWAAGDGASEPLVADAPAVLVTMGTVFGDAMQRFLATVMEAAAAVPARVIVTAATAPSSCPPNVVVVPKVAYLELLPHLAAVMCHAGANTVAEALHFGVPLVVAPIRDDHPIIADRVVATSAGLRVRYRRADAQEIGDALSTVLADNSYRQSAQHIATGFAAAGGAATAAECVLDVATGRLST